MRPGLPTYPPTHPPAATPGWVNNGNYTAGYIILDKDEPTKIIQRGSGQFMVPTYDYETLCNHGNTPPANGCKCVEAVCALSCSIANSKVTKHFVCSDNTTTATAQPH